MMQVIAFINWVRCASGSALQCFSFLISNISLNHICISFNDVQHYNMLQMSCKVIGWLGLLAPHSGCRVSLWGQKGAFLAQTGPLRVLSCPEEVQYQSKVCGNHESNTVRAAGGSRVQIWSLGPPEDLQGHQKESIFSFSESNDFFYLISKREGGSHWINNFLTEKMASKIQSFVGPTLTCLVYSEHQGEVSVRRAC